VEKSQYLQKPPVRLIFDGNFENQEVRYDEENQVELHRHAGRNLCGFSPFPQGKGACGKDAGKLFFPMESRGTALGHGDGHCHAPKGRFGRRRCVLPPHEEQKSAGHSPLQPHDCHSAGVWAIPWRGVYGLSLYTETGTQLTENGLRQSVARYNMRRGVQKTSIHLFRHPFARKYLIDCGGDAFTLQKLLGHSTLAMTEHYCAIYDADLAKNYDNFSPLAQMKAGSEKIKMAAKGR
jgi:hypothetical protein